MINVAIVGLGTISSRVAKGVMSSKNAKLYMMVSRDIEKAKKAVLDYDDVIPATFEDMLVDDNVDLAYLTTPNPVHYEQIKTCLMNKKNVVCEKPMLAKKDELIELFALAKANNVFLMEAEKTLFNSLNQEIKRVIETGEIGEITHIEADYSFDVRPFNFGKNHWMFNKKTGGSLMDVGVYPISFALLHANSKIKEVRGYKKNFEDYDIDFFANFQILFENNVTAAITCSWLNDSVKRGRGIIYGTKGYIMSYTYWKGVAFEIYHNDVVQKFEVSQESEFTNEIDHAAKMIMEKRSESDYFDEAMHLEYFKIFDSVKLI